MGTEGKSASVFPESGGLAVERGGGMARKIADYTMNAAQGSLGLPDAFILANHDGARFTYLETG